MPFTGADVLAVPLARLLGESRMKAMLTVEIIYAFVIKCAPAGEAPLPWPVARPIRAWSGV